MKRAVILVAAVAVMFGCGGGTGSSSGSSGTGSTGSTGSGATGTSTAQPTDPAAAMAQMAKGLQSLQQTGPDGKPIQVVDFEKLQALLPDVSGWEKEKPEGQTQSVAGFTVSTADARYSKGDFHIKLTLTDAALNQMMMLPFTMGMGLVQERSSNGFKRSATYGGQPGHEEWTNDNKNASIVVAVNKRFLVQAEGSGLDSFDQAKEIVNAVDLNKLAALK